MATPIRMVNSTAVITPAAVTPLSLETLPGARTYPRFPGARIRFAGFTLLAFRSGSLVVVGAKDLTVLSEAKQKVQDFLNSCGYQEFRAIELKITNFVFAATMNGTLDLTAAHQHLRSMGRTSFYEMELYPALRVWQSEGTLLIYATGKVILTGVKDHSKGIEIMQKTVEMLSQFKTQIHTTH